MYASVAIVAAITHRERTGQGQYIDSALLDTMVAFNANQIVSYFCSGKIPVRWATPRCSTAGCAFQRRRSSIASRPRSSGSTTTRSTGGY